MKESRTSFPENRNENDFDNLSEILIFKIEEYIDEKFHEAFYDKEDLQDVLFESQNFVNDLQIVYNKVVQCFPPKYNIFNLYKDKYLKNIYNKLKPYIDEKKLELSPGYLILIARWLDKFTESLKKIGVDIKTTDIGCVNLNIYIFNCRTLNSTCICFMTTLMTNYKSAFLQSSPKTCKTKKL